MNDQQQFSIEEDEVEQEDYSNASGVAEEGEKVLDEHDGGVGLSCLIIIDEVNSLDEEGLGEEDVEDDGDDQQQDAEDECELCTAVGDSLIFFLLTRSHVVQLLIQFHINK